MSTNISRRVKALSEKFQKGIGSGKGDGKYSDSIDGSVDGQERARAIATQKLVKGALAQALHAAHLAEKGSYGKCEMCKFEIDPARLEVFPEATLCINCAKRLQRAKPVA